MQVEEPPIVSFHAAAPGGEVNIRIASTAERHAAASLLLRKMYAWRGYAFDVASAAASNKVTFYAETDGILVGTMSVWFDRHGELPADASYGDHLALLRRQGRRLCEPSRLAIDAGLCKRVFAGLIHVSYIYAHHLQGFSDYVIEVNPRHVGFYRRMLGFSELGGERACARVGAPAVLLRLPLEHMGAEIRRCGGTMEQSGERSFYPYFFPVRDEPGIIARLTADSAQGDAA